MEEWRWLAAALVFGLVVLLLSRSSEAKEDRVAHRLRAQEPVEGHTSHGTAFAVAPRVVVTAAHVLYGLKNEKVRIEVGGEWLDCHVIRVDEYLDIAVLRTEVDLQYHTLSKELPRKGQRITVSVSTEGKAVENIDGKIDTYPNLRLSKPGGEGDSGGPVFDRSSGEVVGIIRARTSDTTLMQFVPGSLVRQRLIEWEILPKERP